VGSQYLDDGVGAREAEMHLMQYGMKIRPGDPEIGAMLCVAKKHPRIRELLRNSSFATGYDVLLGESRARRRWTPGPRASARGMRSIGRS